MQTKFLMVLLLVLIEIMGFSAPLLCHGEVRQLHYVNKDLHFSFTLPGDWIPALPETVKADSDVAKLVKATYQKKKYAGKIAPVLAVLSWPLPVHFSYTKFKALIISKTTPEERPNLYFDDTKLRAIYSNLQHESDGLVHLYNVIFLGNQNIVELIVTGPMASDAELKQRAHILINNFQFDKGYGWRDIASYLIVICVIAGLLCICSLVTIIYLFWKQPKVLQQEREKAFAGKGDAKIYSLSISKWFKQYCTPLQMAGPLLLLIVTFIMQPNLQARLMFFPLLAISYLIVWGMTKKYTLPSYEVILDEDGVTAPSQMPRFMNYTFKRDWLPYSELVIPSEPQKVNSIFWWVLKSKSNPDRHLYISAALENINECMATIYERQTH